MDARNIRQRLHNTEGITLAQAAIPRPVVHRGQVTNRDRAILQRGVALSPNLIQRPLQFDRFRATRFDYQLHCDSPNDQVDLSSVMRGGDEHEKMALDGFMQQFFHSLLEQKRNYRDSAGNVPSPRDEDIVHLYIG